MIAPVEPSSVEPSLVERSRDRTPLAQRSINHAAIAHNVRRVLGIARTPLMAVVKADAFGHGAVDVARTALSAGAAWLGVATVDEALELRAAGIRAPVFAWLIDPWCDLESAIRHDVTLSCANQETLAAIWEAAALVGEPAAVHLELDTGMSRGGSTVALWGALCEAAADAERAGLVRVSGLWSHLALAGRVGEWNVAPAVEAFTAGATVAYRAGLDPEHLHLGNSAAALAHPSARFSMVRVGAALYGIETVAGARFDLEPALRLTSRVTQVRDVVAGTGVGYLHEYRTRSSTRLALVPVGYGDGIPRLPGATVSIGGARFPIRGVVSMDQLVVEVDDRVALGDEVVVIGDGRRGEPSAQEWAVLAGTVAHDILAGLGSRVSRS